MTKPIRLQEVTTPTFKLNVKKKKRGVRCKKSQYNKQDKGTFALRAMCIKRKTH